MAALSSIFNFEHPAFEFYLYDLIQVISTASHASVLFGCIYYHGAGLIQRLLTNRLTPKYTHIALIGLKVVTLADFLAGPVRSSLSPLHQTPLLCPAKRPFLHRYVHGALRLSLTGAAFFVSKLLYRPLRALHPYAPAVTAAVFTTYDIWRPIIRFRAVEESFVEVFRRYFLAPVRQSLHERRSLLSSSFLVVGSGAPLFKYPQLPRGNMIRLLKLKVEEATPDRVACELLAVDIDTAPPYDAISYVWGSFERKYSLLIDDTVKRQVPITASAHNVLRTITPLCGTRYLWIDSICISQGDEAEKDQQIPLMNKIYGRAAEVVLCLDESSTAATAVSFLNQLVWYYICKDQSLLWTTFNKNKELRASYTVDLPFIEDTQSWEAWRSFVNNNYWTRVWIIQECAMAKEITLIYGGIPLAWDIVLFSTIIMTSSVSNLQNRIAKTAHDSVERICLIIGQRSSYLEDGPTKSLVELVVGFRDSLATNPEDKVNALLGISRDSGVLALQPNSKRSVKEVYANVVKLALQNSSFYSFSISGLSHRQRGNSLLELPSWVPDLTRSQTLETSYYHERDYTAGTSMPVEFDISAQWDQLRVKGVFVDTIIATSFHSDLPEAVRLAIRGADHPDGFELVQDVTGRLLQMLQLFDLYLPIIQDHYGESDLKECVWQTITDDFNGKKFSNREELTRLLEDIQQYVAGLQEELSRPFQESQKFSVRELELFLSSKVAAKSFWSENDYSEVFKFILGPMCTAATAVSKSGLIALAPLGTKAGDIIVVFQGSPVPHILRATNNHDGTYFLWGEAYVHGAMHGEAMDAEKTRFVLN